MPHFIDAYADRLNDLLHVAGGAKFFKQEVLEVPGLLTCLLITHDNVSDDIREVYDHMTWDQFLNRISLVMPDWSRFDKAHIEHLATQPHRTIHGAEGRAIYFLRGGNHPEQWSAERAKEDVLLVLGASTSMRGVMVLSDIADARASIPTGHAHFSKYEHLVRVVFNYLFLGDLEAGQPQSRTEPENEGVEIRDIIFANVSKSGFWKDLKDKYSASEIVVDAKNTDNLTRDDLRQLYCYLKPALGYWGFIVCRSEPSPAIVAFNRTLHQNFKQERGVLILSDDDLRRMADLKNRGNDPTRYLQQKMSAFLRTV